MRSLIRVILMDKVENRVISKRCGVTDDVVTTIEKSMLGGFRHLKRMHEEKNAEKDL